MHACTVHNHKTAVHVLVIQKPARDWQDRRTVVSREHTPNQNKPPTPRHFVSNSNQSYIPWVLTCGSGNDVRLRASLNSLRSRPFTNKFCSLASRSGCAKAPTMDAYKRLMLFSPSRTACVFPAVDDTVNAAVVAGVADVAKPAAPLSPPSSLSPQSRPPPPPSPSRLVGVNCL